MNKTFFATVLSVFSYSSMIGQTEHQSIKDYIDAYVGENATPYLQPLADLFSSNLNTGVWEWSGMPDKFYIRIKLQGMLSLPDKSMRTFTGKTTGDFEPFTSAEVPTIIGNNTPVIIQGNDNTFYVFPGGYDLDKILLGTPQVTVGGLLHTELSGRFIAVELSKDIGRVEMTGVGFRHDITGWGSDPSFDFSVGYFYHHVQSEGYLNSHHHYLSAQLGKTMGVASGFIGAGYQFSKTDLHYVYEDENESIPVDLTLENKNQFLIEAGLALRLGPVYASGVVSYAKLTTVAFGAGVFF